jgi:hypothetical protein
VLGRPFRLSQSREEELTIRPIPDCLLGKTTRQGIGEASRRKKESISVGSGQETVLMRFANLSSTCEPAKKSELGS